MYSLLKIGIFHCYVTLQKDITFFHGKGFMSQLANVFPSTRFHHFKPTRATTFPSSCVATKKTISPSKSTQKKTDLNLKLQPPPSPNPPQPTLTNPQHPSTYKARGFIRNHHGPRGSEDFTDGSLQGETHPAGVGTATTAPPGTAALASLYHRGSTAIRRIFLGANVVGTPK